MQYNLFKNKNISIIKFCLISLLLFYSNLFFANNKNFEGEISYKIIYEDGINKEVLETLPKKATLLIKDRKSYYYSNSGLGTQGIIYDDSKKISYTLLDIFDRTLAIKKETKDFLQERETFKIEKIKHSSETKTILGYVCKKVVITVYIPKLNRNIELNAFYTTTLGNNEWINNADPIYYQIKGILLEYDIQLGNTFMSLSAEMISPKKISANEFQIPKRYKIVNIDEVSQSFKQ